MQEQIKIYDNVLDEGLRQFLVNKFFGLKTWELHGSENIDEISNNKIVRNFFYSPITDETINHLFTYHLQRLTQKNFRVIRSYVNCYSLNNGSDWHQDDGELTFLYYPQDWKQEYGGETIIRIDDREIPVSYKTNRLLVFPAKLYHKAKLHTNPVGFRFTVAFKTEEKE